MQAQSEAAKKIGKGKDIPEPRWNNSRISTGALETPALHLAHSTVRGVARQLVSVENFIDFTIVVTAPVWLYIKGIRGQLQLGTCPSYDPASTYWESILMILVCIIFSWGLRAWSEQYIKLYSYEAY